MALTVQSQELIKLFVPLSSLSARKKDMGRQCVYFGEFIGHASLSHFWRSIFFSKNANNKLFQSLQQTNLSRVWFDYKNF